MKLVIGGYAQGKLNYVLQENKKANYVVFDGKLPDKIKLQEMKKQGKEVLINQFHLWVKEGMLKGEKPEETINKFIQLCPESVIISDEIGNGIVPIDAFEREYREQTGRILITLAKQADEVVRVLCGIGQRIK